MRARFGVAGPLLLVAVLAASVALGPAAGLARFATWKVWVYAGASVVLWNLFVVGLGLFAGTHLDLAKRILIRYSFVALVFLGICAVGWVLIILVRRYARR